MKQALTALALCCAVLGTAFAQAQPPAAPGTASAPAAPAATAAPEAAAGGIRGQNIFEVKPEASEDPNYPNLSLIHI